MVVPLDVDEPAGDPSTAGVPVPHPLTRRRLAAAIALVAVAAATGCGDSKPADPNEPTTLNVWLMKDSAPDAVVSQINDEFHAAHPNVTVKTQILAWDGPDAK